MRPDQRWFPTNRSERAAWYRVFTANFTEQAIALGFDQSDIDQLNADNDVVQFTASAINGLDAAMRGVRAYEKTITEGKIGGAWPHFPAIEVGDIPNAVPPGIYERLEKLVRRIRVAPKYTPTAGALFGIIPSPSYTRSALEAAPDLKISRSAKPYSFVVSFAKRKYTAFALTIKRANRDEWENAAYLTGSPATVTVQPQTAGVWEKIDVRLQPIVKNVPTGNFSNIVETIVGE